VGVVVLHVRAHSGGAVLRVELLVSRGAEVLGLLRNRDAERPVPVHAEERVQPRVFRAHVGTSRDGVLAASRVAVGVARAADHEPRAHYRVALVVEGRHVVPERRLSVLLAARDRVSGDVRRVDVVVYERPELLLPRVVGRGWASLGPPGAVVLHDVLPHVADLRGHGYAERRELERALGGDRDAPDGRVDAVRPTRVARLVAAEVAQAELLAAGLGGERRGEVGRHARAEEGRLAVASIRPSPPLRKNSDAKLSLRTVR